MDSLVLEIERLLMGGHLDVETSGQPNSAWLAEELAKIYKGHQSRVGAVKVTAYGDSVRIEGPNKTRTLKAEGTWWTLAGALGHAASSTARAQRRNFAGADSRH